MIITLPDGTQHRVKDPAKWAQTDDETKRKAIDALMASRQNNTAGTTPAPAPDAEPLQVELPDGSMHTVRDPAKWAKADEETKRKALDAQLRIKVGEEESGLWHFIQSAGKGFTAGLDDPIKAGIDPDMTIAHQRALTEARRDVSPYASGIGEIVGGAGSLLWGGPAIGAAAKVGSKALPTAAKIFAKKPNLTRNTAGGTSYGAVYGATEEADQGIGDMATSALMHGLAGGIGGAVIPPVLSKAGQVIGKYAPSVRLGKEAGTILTGQHKADEITTMMNKAVGDQIEAEDPSFAFWQDKDAGTLTPDGQAKVGERLSRMQAQLESLKAQGAKEYDIAMLANSTDEFADNNPIWNSMVNEGLARKGGEAFGHNLGIRTADDMVLNAEQFKSGIDEIKSRWTEGDLKSKEGDLAQTRIAINDAANKLLEKAYKYRGASSSAFFNAFNDAFGDMPLPAKPFTKTEEALNQKFISKEVKEEGLSLVREMKAEPKIKNVLLARQKISEMIKDARKERRRDYAALTQLAKAIDEDVAALPDDIYEPIKLALDISNRVHKAIKPSKKQGRGDIKTTMKLESSGRTLESAGKDETTARHLVDYLNTGKVDADINEIDKDLITGIRKFIHRAKVNRDKQKAESPPPPPQTAGTTPKTAPDATKTAIMGEPKGKGAKPSPASPTTPADAVKTSIMGSPAKPASPRPVVGPPRPPAVPVIPPKKATPASAPDAVKTSIMGPPKPSKQGVTPEFKNKTNTVATPNAEQDFKITYDVIDAGKIKQAEGDLQPRDRSRKESPDQISNGARNLRPEWLIDSPRTDTGAPIVNKDNTIISGNGRTQMITKAYDINNGAGYRKMIEDAGFDTTGMSRPVLVRRIADDMTHEEQVKIARLSNEAGSSEYSATEKALTDAEKIGHIIDLYNDKAELGKSGNRKFVKQFAQIISPNERGAFSVNGVVTSAGIRRIQNALMAYAYPDEQLLTQILDNTEVNIASILKSMLAVAPRIAKLKEQAPKYDISENLIKLARAVSEAKTAKGGGVIMRDVLNQTDAFEKMDGATEILIRSFFNDKLVKAKSIKEMTAILNGYLDQAELRVGGDDILGTAPTKTDILKLVTKKEAENAAKDAKDFKLKMQTMGATPQTPPKAKAKTQAESSAASQQKTPPPMAEPDAPKAAEKPPMTQIQMAKTLRQFQTEARKARQAIKKDKDVSPDVMRGLTGMEKALNEANKVVNKGGTMDEMMLKIKAGGDLKGAIDAGILPETGALSQALRGAKIGDFEADLGKGANPQIVPKSGIDAGDFERLSLDEFIKKHGDKTTQADVAKLKTLSQKFKALDNFANQHKRIQPKQAEGLKSYIIEELLGLPEKGAQIIGASMGRALGTGTLQSPAILASAGKRYSRAVMDRFKISMPQELRTALASDDPELMTKFLNKYSGNGKGEKLAERIGKSWIGAKIVDNSGVIPAIMAIQATQSQRDRSNGANQ